MKALKIKWYKMLANYNFGLWIKTTENKYLKRYLTLTDKVYILKGFINNEL